MQNQKGITIIEVIATLAIIGIILPAGISALINSSKAAVKTDQMDTARSLALSQIEYIKRQPFSTSGYSADDTILSQYSGYSASVSSVPAQDRDANIQRITVTVTYLDIYNGQNASTILQDFKVK
jgi:prepilin-type N-terminal cleavage/methylation domain-containing protein